MTSDLLHNRNCFNYLRNLKIPGFVLADFPPSLAAALNPLRDAQKEDYNPEFPYGDVYTQFFTYLEEHIETIYDARRRQLLAEQAKMDLLKTLPVSDAISAQQVKALKQLGVLSEVMAIKQESAQNSTLAEAIDRKTLPVKEEINALDDFIFSLYDNDNFILEDTFERIKELALAQSPSSGSLERRISRHMEDVGERINVNSQSPAQAGSAYGRFTAMISDNFKPQHTTSLATVRHYGSNAHSKVREYRFGTQGQRHEGEERVSPLFERFLQVQAARAPAGKITHIYFNNLGRDRTDAEGLKEKALTEQLEGLEHTHKNVAVITLPADKGLMHKGDYKNLNSKYSYADLKNEFLQIAMEDPDSPHLIKDFHISLEIRKRIFSDPESGYSPDIEKAQLAALLDKSFAALGISADAVLSPSQRQAVWFHFIKFELTNHIIEALDPQSINFSCKDAIDRGGVSSAYYNLIKSFEPAQTPMTREEFDRALHAAPAMVKARGMNHHANLIWNAVDAYVNTHYESLKHTADKAWLIEWRDFNCPHHRVGNMLENRLQQLKEDLEDAKKGPISAHKQDFLQQGSAILNEIERQSRIGVSGKRLLLDAAVRTTAMALHPEAQSTANKARYEAVGNKLAIDHPALTVLRGMMRSFVGAVVFLCTLGRKQALLDSGIATVRSGMEAEARKELQLQMKSQLHRLKDDSLKDEISLDHAEENSHTVPCKN